MGNSLTSPPGPISYAVRTELPPYPDATGIYRSAQYPDALIDDMADFHWENQWDCFCHMADNPEVCNHEFLGSRHWISKELRSVDSDEKGMMKPRNELGCLTYLQAKELATNLAAGIESKNYISYTEFPDENYPPARRLRMCGLVSKNRPEWFVSELACAVANYCLVPLYDSLSVDALHRIMDQTQMSVLICSKESFNVLYPMIEKLFKGEGSKTAAAGSEGRVLKCYLKYVVLFDNFDDALVARAAAVGITEVSYWKDLCALGAKVVSEISFDHQKRKDVASVCYTSGTTGDPKGVMITAQNFLSILCAHQRCIMSHPGFRAGFNDIHMSYLPLAHVFERMICANCIVLGVKIACYSGDTQNLLEDMRIICPTIFLSVPRLFMRIHDKIVSTIGEKTNVARYIFETAVNAKLRNLRENGTYTHAIWDPLVFKKTRALLGGQVKYMLVGGAPLESIVQEKISIIFCCPIMHGFGMTEIGPVFICNPGERLAGHIGGVQPAVEFCLRSVPETGYFVSFEDGNPKGELVVRGHAVSPGYLEIDSDNEEPEGGTEVRSRRRCNGWFHTGDIGELLTKNGNSIKIIDRKKNIFKLSQGEYVPPERVENIYSAAPLVGQIMVYGDATQSYLVAIINPDHGETMKWASQARLNNKSYSELCDSEELKEAVMNSLHDVEAEGAITGFQKVKKITLTADPFTIENKMLTPTLKLRRSVCKQVYLEAISKMYEK